MGRLAFQFVKERAMNTVIMKRTTSLIAAGLLVAGPAFAETWGSGNQDVYGTVLHDLDKPAMVGTSMSVASSNVDPYFRAFAGNPDISADGFLRGAAGPEGHGPWGEGNVDTYGTILR
jgi:hypothetical protein